METTFSSFNVRGLRNQNKRDHIFHWLKSNNYNISLLQETHSNKDCVTKWEREWEGKAFFSGDKKQ